VCYDLARSVKMTEPPAPATTAIRATARRPPRTRPSDLPGLVLAVISSEPLMLIDPFWHQPVSVAGRTVCASGACGELCKVAS
jgi:hypothetical protein